MPQLFANNAYSSLSASLGASGTSLTLATGTGSRFPSPTGGNYFLLTLIGLDSNGNENSWEIVKVTGRASDVLTIVRAQESTTAVAWASGTRAELRSTAGTFSGLQPLDDDLTALAALSTTGILRRTGANTFAAGNITLSGDVTGTGTTPLVTTLANSGVTAGTYTKVTVDAKGRVTTGASLASSDVTTALTFTPENVANKNAANGYAGLDSSGLIPSSLLPSYVDDVLEYSNLAGFPGTGTTGKIYVALDTGKIYRWSGSAYIEISASPGSTDSVTEGSVNLYFTTARARSSITVTQNLTYNSTTGVITGPDLTGYMPLAGGTMTGAITFAAGQTFPGTGDVTTTGTQTLTNKTLTSPTINTPTIAGATFNDGYTEEVFAISGTTPALSANNGSIQTWTLTANSTPTDSLSNGQSILLGVTAGSFTITWPTTTWSKVGGSGAAPTLTSTGVNWIVFWKVGGTLRAAFLGTA